MLHRSAKILLQNELRHTGTHNRMVEEQEMWRHKEKRSVSSSSRKDKDKDKDRDKDKDNDKDQEKTSVFFEDTRKSFLYDNRIRDDAVSYGKCRAHMDDEPVPLSTTRSTYWMRQLQKAEEKDPARWGHNGYKELYPDEFRSDRSESEDDDGHRHRHKSRSSRKRKEKKHRHHYRSRSDDRRSEDRKSEDRKSDDSRSRSGDSEPQRRRRKSTGCSKHRKHRRSRDLSSGSETVRYIRRKIRKERRRRKHRPSRRMGHTDIEIKQEVHSGDDNGPRVVRRRRSTSSRREGDRDRPTRDRPSMRDHRQSRHMSSDNSDSGAEEDVPKRQKFQRDYSSSDSEDSYCMA